MSNNEDPRLSGPLADMRANGDGFRTPPPDYFDALTDRVLKDVARPPAVTRRLYQPWMAIAASLLLLLVAGFLLFPNSTDNQLATDNRQPTTADELLADLDPEDIEAYIATDLDNFESEIYAANADNDYPYE